MHEFAVAAILLLSKMLVFYFLALNAIYLALLLIGVIQVSSYYRRHPYLGHDIIEASAFTPPISVLVPCFNEERIVSEVVDALLTLEYPQHEVIVINDGSTDDTVGRLRRDFNLMRVDRIMKRSIPCKQVRGYYVSARYPNLVVIDKANGGKADALNCGVNFSQYPLVCTIDADTILEKRSLIRIVTPFVDAADEIAAVGGIVRIANDCDIRRGKLTRIRAPRSILAGLQAVEYLRAFFAGRTGWSALNALLIISGAFSCFRKDVVVAVGGFAVDCIGEDAEIVLRIHKHLRKNHDPRRIIFIADPVCWTEAPEDWRMLVKQRQRWHIGLIETLSRHWKMMGNPRYGRLGLLAIPYFFFFEMLGPFVEVVGLAVIVAGLLLGITDMQILLAFFTASVLFGVLLSAGSVVIEEYSYNRYEGWKDLWRPLAYAVIENFGYRQVLSFVRTWAFVSWARGKRGWDPQKRKGFGNRHAARPKRGTTVPSPVTPPAPAAAPHHRARAGVE